MALPPYLVSSSAFDSLVGLRRGLVAHPGGRLSSVRRAVLAGAVDALAASLRHPVALTATLIGGLSWAVAAGAAAVARRRGGGCVGGDGPLGLAGVVGAVGDAAPFGPIAMMLFLVAAGVLSRPRSLRSSSRGLRDPTRKSDNR